MYVWSVDMHLFKKNILDPQFLKSKDLEPTQMVGKL